MKSANFKFVYVFAGFRSFGRACRHSRAWATWLEACGGLWRVFHSQDSGAGSAASIRNENREH